MVAGFDSCRVQISLDNIKSDHLHTLITSFSHMTMGCTIYNMTGLYLLEYNGDSEILGLADLGRAAVASITWADSGKGGFKSSAAHVDFGADKRFCFSNCSSFL